MSRRCKIAILAILSLSLCVVPAWAGSNIWTPTGPNGGPIRSMLVDPSTPSIIYIGTGGSGVFKSVDTGVTWAQSDPTGPLASRTVRALIFGPPGTIYAGSDTAVDSSAGVFQSIDSGTTWTALTNQPTNKKVQALAWDGTSLYAGTREESPTTGGVFKLNVAAGTWTQINTGLPNQSARRVQAFAIDPRPVPPVVYAGTQGEGVFKSIDSGANWLRVDNPANQGFKSDCLEKPEILVLAVDTTLALFPVPAQGDTGAVLYAGATGSTGDTTDPLNQACWETPAHGGDQGQGAGFFRLVPEGFNGGCPVGNIPAFLGCWDRQMNGAFEDLLPATVSSEVWSIVMIPSATPPVPPTRIYIGTDIGVFTSNDSASSWDAVPRDDLPDGLIGLPIRALGIDPAAICTGGTVRLHAGTGGRGMFARCPNLPVGELPWTLTNGGLTALRAQSVAAASLADGTSKVYAGLVGGGIVTSVDLGVSWQNTSESELTVRAIAPDPGAANVVYAATGMGVIKTTNGGTTWTLKSTDLPQVCNVADTICLRAQSPNNPNPPRTVRAILVDPAKSGVVYAAVGGVYRSLNGGESWSALNGTLGPLPDEVKCGVSCPGSGTVSAIVVDHSSGHPVYGTLYIATDGSALPVPAHGVYRSTDGGLTWTAVMSTAQVPLVDQYITSLGLDPLPAVGLPITLYAGTTTGKVYVTQNGTAWVSPAGVNLLPGNAVTALAIELADPRVIYAALSSGGVYFSVNGGFDWTALNTGLASLDVVGLAIDGTTSPHALYAATLGRGMHELKIALTSAPFVFLDPSLDPPYPLETSSSPMTVSGTFFDDTGVSKVLWSTNRGHAGTATLTGGLGWTAPVTLEPGLNVITVTAIDTNVPSNEGSTSLTVNLPAAEPEIFVSPLSIPFGTVAVGVTSTLQNVTVRNDGVGDLILGVITLGGANPDQFKQAAAQDLCSGQTLLPTQTCTVGLKFKPTSAGLKNATLVIPSNDSDEPSVQVTLSGTGGNGGAPEITVSPLSIPFGTVAVGVTSTLQNVTVRNDGAGDLILGVITLGGANPDQYKQAAAQDLCSGHTLLATQTCTVGLKFKPTSTGLKNATLVIPSNDSDESSVQVTLSGTGGNGGAPEIFVSPLSIPFGTVTVGSTSTLQNVTVRNDGAGDLILGVITLGGANPDQYKQAAAQDLCSGHTLLATQTCTVGLKFKPTTPGVKNATLVIPSNDSDESTVTVTLSGTGQ